MALFDDIKAAGIPFASHETDLYIPDTPETRAILKRYPLSDANKTSFTNQVEGGRWFDIPFAYLPAWEAKTKRGSANALDNLGYPLDWPKCPTCGKPVLDGHRTCGRIECGKS